MAKSKAELEAEVSALTTENEALKAKLAAYPVLESVEELAGQTFETPEAALKAGWNAGVAKQAAEVEQLNEVVAQLQTQNGLLDAKAAAAEESAAKSAADALELTTAKDAMQALLNEAEYKIGELTAKLEKADREVADAAEAAASAARDAAADEIEALEVKIGELTEKLEAAETALLDATAKASDATESAPAGSGSIPAAPEDLYDATLGDLTPAVVAWYQENHPALIPVIYKDREHRLEEAERASLQPSFQQERGAEDAQIAAELAAKQVPADKAKSPLPAA